MLTHFVGMLGGIPNCEQVFSALIIGDQTPRLHGGRCEALDLVGLPHHMFGLGESGIQVASGAQRPEGDIASHVRVDDHRALFHRLVRVDHGGQDLVIHHNLFQSIGGGVGILGDDDRHGLADVTNLVGREDRMPGRVELVGAGIGPGRNLYGQVLYVGCGEDGHHSWHTTGSGDIDGADIGVGVEATEHNRVQETRQR